MEHAPRKAAPRVIIRASSVELSCPHCGAAQPAPGGSEFCEPTEAREMCNGDTRPCVACDEPIKMIWHNKVEVA